MTFRNTFLALALSGFAAACSNSPSDTGPVNIAIQQALTGQTTAAGTFLGPLDRSPVPVTFTRQLTGARGVLSIKGNATLTFTSPTAATVAGDWQVESGTGAYAAMKGTGRLSGTADFGAAPPTAALSMAGSLVR